jgi:hypothetical protein
MINLEYPDSLRRRPSLPQAVKRVGKVTFLKTPSFRRREGAGGELNMQADGYELLYRLQSQLTLPTAFGTTPSTLSTASGKEGEEKKIRPPLSAGERGQGAS